MSAPACTCFASGRCGVCRDYIGAYVRSVRREERRKQLRRQLLGAIPTRIVELEWAFWNINDRVQALEAAQ